MTPPIAVNIPHQLAAPRPGAASNRASRTGAHSRWSRRLRRTLGRRTPDLQRVADGPGRAGIIDVRDTVVAMEIALPGVLGLLASGLKGRLEKAGQLLLTRK